MNFLITGGTGFIGSALCAHLCEQGHNIVVKTRRPELVSTNISSVRNLGEISADTNFDVVINFAGEPIADKKWSAMQKAKIVDSRIETTEEIIVYLNKALKKPAVFISGSAIGYYGVGTSNKLIDESSVGDNSFSSRLCAQWEACAVQAEALGIRTCLLRIGIVLGKDGGALKKMLLPFKLGLGGKIGSGKQWMPWIHLGDLIGIIDFCIEQTSLRGPLNCTAPIPVTNREFSKTLGSCLRRPALLPMPAFVIKALLGDMGKELLLAGKQVCPVKLEAAGFRFKYQHLDAALSSVL